MGHVTTETSLTGTEGTTMPSPTPITTQLCDRLDDYAIELARLAMPEPARVAVASGLREVRALAWQADEARRKSHYVADTGDVSEWITRADRRHAKRPA